MTNEELGTHLARELFKMGDTGGDLCQRIQFKGGRTCPGVPETDLGGFGEKPLARWFTQTLNKANADNG